MTAARALLVLALAAVAMPTATGAEAPIADPAREPAGELRICVDPDNPPLSINRAAEKPGSDVEIAQAIAARLELRPRLIWVDTTYGGRALRRSLLAGQCQLFMGLPVDAAAETPDALAFTTPYYSTGYRLVRASARSNPAPAEGGLATMRIAVERQSGAQMRLEQIGSHLVVYGSQQEVVEAVARGEADAGAVWLSDVDRLVRGRTLSASAAADAAPEQPLRWNMAIGTRRADADLRSAVNDALADLLAQGRIKAIFDRYRIPFFPPFAAR
jgi:ABC-type amino acid transport substrate-binding protein